jgi:hypothetical protein
VGRSLREIELRIDGIGEITLLGWGSTLIVSLLAIVLLFREKKLL